MLVNAALESMKAIAPRRISLEETAVVKQALLRAALTPVRETILATVASLCVTGECECGCRSFEFQTEKREEHRIVGSLTLHCFLLDFLGFFFFLRCLGGFLLRRLLAVLALAHDVCSVVGKIENLPAAEGQFIIDLRAVVQRLLRRGEKKIVMQ